MTPNRKTKTVWERKEGRTVENAAKKVISTGQATALLELMAAFYSDPKNRAAYEKWRAARTKKSHT